jgi:hypothetical protein
VDGLLLTRRERIRSYSERTALLLGPSLVLALVVLAMGQWADAIVVAAVAGMTALSLGSTLRTRLGAAIFGILLLAGLVAFLFVISWFVSHPIQSGD